MQFADHMTLDGTAEVLEGARKLSWNRFLVILELLEIEVDLVAALVIVRECFAQEHLGLMLNKEGLVDEGDQTHCLPG